MLGPAQASGDWGALAMCEIARGVADDPELVLTLGNPFGGAEYGRIGHPKPVGKHNDFPQTSPFKQLRHPMGSGMTCVMTIHFELIALEQGGRHISTCSFVLSEKSPQAAFHWARE